MPTLDWLNRERPMRSAAETCENTNHETLRSTRRP